MKKRGLVILGLGLLILSLVVVVFEVTFFKQNSKHSIIENQEEIDIIDYSGIKENVSYFGFDYTPFSTFENATYNVETSYSAEFGLESYNIGNDTISYEVNVGQEVTINVYHNKILIYTGAYLFGDNYLDIALTKNSIISYFHENNKLSSVAIDDTMLYVEKTSDNVISLKLDDNIDKSFSYLNDKISNEVNGDKNYSYEYDENNNIIYDYKDNIIVNSNNDEINFTYNNDSYKYVFGYKYNNRKFITETYKNGILTGQYSYINDLLISKKVNGVNYLYVIDNSGNYLGLIVNDDFYLFLHDTSGVVYALINSYTNKVTYIESTAFGSYSIENLETDILFENCIVYPDAVIDTSSGFIIKNEEIIIPSIYKKISNDAIMSLNYEDNFVEEEFKIALTDLPAMHLFKDKVVTEVIKRFKNKGLLADSYVSVVDGADNKYMIADVYTLDYSETNNSIQNIVNGNQVYKVIYGNQNHNYQKELTQKYQTLLSEIDLYKSNYITKYSNKKGTMIFNGQFIYLGYLVTYQSDGNGIIRYTLSENNSLYYRTWNSIYNYDTNKYVNYSEIQFNESLWEYTRIIPGVNREEYEIIEKAINEVIKFEGISVQKQLEYLDENYNNVAHFNSVGDSLRNYDISDEEMIVLQDDGNLKVQYLPFFDNETNVKNLIKIGGIIASLTVVGIVCVAVPGLQVFIPIVAAAMKGAAVALVSTTVFKVTSLIIEMDWTNFEDVDWNKVLRDYVQECAVDMALGAALGAVKGGIDVFSNATFKKIELNRVHKQYEYLIPEDDMYGTMEYANHIFSIEQKYIKSTEKLLSTKTKDLFIEVNKKIATKSLFKFVKEYKWEA